MTAITPATTLSKTLTQLRIASETPSYTPPPASAADAAAPAQEGRNSLGKLGSKARVLEVLRSLGWSDLLPLVEAAPEEGIFERTMMDHLPLERWATDDGRVVLLGDAAHAMHTQPGLGARSAFEVRGGWHCPALCQLL